MKKIEGRMPVAMRTPETEATSVVEEILYLWEMWGFEAELGFMESIFKNLWDAEDTRGDCYIDQLKQIEEMTDWYGAPFPPRFKEDMIQVTTALVSIAFAIQAMKSERNSASAWPYACEANHWLGVLHGYIWGAEVNSRKAFSAKGAIGKYAPMNELRLWVLNRYAAGNWPSMNNAATHIAPEAIKKAPEFNTRISLERAQKTVYGWLKADAKTQAND